MSKVVRKYDEIRVGEDTFKVWTNPPMSLFMKIAGGEGGIAGQMATLGEVIVEHTFTSEDDEPLAVKDIPTPDLLAFLGAYIERLKAVPKAS